MSHRGRINFYALAQPPALVSERITKRAVAHRVGRMKCAWAHSIPHDGWQAKCPMQLSGCHMDFALHKPTLTITCLGSE